MMSQCSIPTHLTVLYMFAALSLTILFNLTVVEADVIAIDLNNQTLWKAADSQALFGAPIPDEGIWGHLIYQRTNCCEVKSVEPPPKHNGTVKYIAMIKRGPCQFETKVYNAQLQGYDAVIIHNVGSDELERMGPGTKNLRVNISSVFIGAHDAQKFEKYDRSNKYYLKLENNITPVLPPDLYLVPFVLIFGISFILMLTFMVARWVRDIRHRRRSRLSLAHLKKIPVKRFKKGDQYDVCAICLDEYEDGDKLRILPCSHGYHQKCIDPWLTKNKKFCPICKRKVIPGEEDSESEEDSDEDGGQNENTPLLAQTASNTVTSTTRGGTFDHSGLPTALRDNVQQLCYDDTSSEDSFTVSTSNYHSSVEVHQPGATHVTTITMDDSSNTESADSDGDDVTDHVISNNTNANPLISIVSDHFGAANHVGSINGDEDTGSRSSLDEYRPLMEEAVAVNATAVVVQPSDRQPERDQII